MRYLRIIGIGIFFVLACGKNNKSNNSSGSNGNYSGSPVQKPTADMVGALSILVVDPGQSSGSGLVQLHNKYAMQLGAPVLNASEAKSFGFDGNEFALATSTDGTNSLQKTDADGNVKNALTSSTLSSNSNGPQQDMPLPKILTIALSPAPYNEIFLHFEQPFRFVLPTSNNTQNSGDPRLDGSYCQLFRIKGGSIADLKTKAPTEDNLECLDANHFINQWSASRTSVFQFDSKGNAYFPGSIPNSSKMVVYKWDRTNGELTEMINANICVQDFLVTPSGGMFYTGTSSCDGSPSSGGGFFRYISSGAKDLTEIARNWYNFIYEPVSTATGDQAIFFGPDPTSATTASWNSACIFKFDPTGSTTAQRTSSVITCGSDIWKWIQMNRTEDIATYGDGFQNGGDASTAWKTEFNARCTSSGQIFAGGGSQISSIRQDSTGQVYVIGNVRKKNAGTVECGVEIRGPHCKDSEGDPDISVTTESACTASSGTWVDEGFCQGATGVTSADCFGASGTWNRRSVQYNGTSGTLCTSNANIAQTDWWSADNTKSFQTAANAGANVLKFRTNYMNCSPPTSSNSGGDQWTSEYQGLGKVNTSTLTLSLLSGTDEQAIQLWVINDKVYYSSFNATSGKYLLRSYDGSQVSTMVENLEVYHLSDSSETDKLFYDGLDFSNNTYSFGTLLVNSPYTRSSKVGLTGTLKTVVLLPK